MFHLGPFCVAVLATINFIAYFILNINYITTPIIITFVLTCSTTNAAKTTADDEKNIYFKLFGPLSFDFEILKVGPFCVANCMVNIIICYIWKQLQANESTCVVQPSEFSIHPHTQRYHLTALSVHIRSGVSL